MSDNIAKTLQIFMISLVTAVNLVITSVNYTEIKKQKQESELQTKHIIAKIERVQNIVIPNKKENLK